LLFTTRVPIGLVFGHCFSSNHILSSRTSDHYQLHPLHLSWPVHRTVPF
jgi:hypothetical protein